MLKKKKKKTAIEKYIFKNYVVSDIYVNKLENLAKRIIYFGNIIY